MCYFIFLGGGEKALHFSRMNPIFEVLGFKRGKFVFMKSECSIILCSLGKHVVVCVFVCLKSIFSVGWLTGFFHSWMYIKGAT